MTTKTIRAHCVEQLTAANIGVVYDSLTTPLNPRLLPAIIVYTPKNTADPVSITGNHYNVTTLLEIQAVAQGTGDTPLADALSDLEVAILSTILRTWGPDLGSITWKGTEFGSLGDGDYRRGSLLITFEVTRRLDLDRFEPEPIEIMMVDVEHEKRYLTSWKGEL